ncbi:MAG: TPM domain-containing protein [Deltaproteobacteria bacterium]|nr:TPM domain-containing protein [Deltaproteobacteria bacterium]
MTDPRPPGGAAVRRVFALAFVLAFAAWRAEAAPAPLPTPLGFVSDFAGVIDGATKARLAARIGELKEKTGSEIAVVTLATTRPDPVPERAVRLAEAWKPGGRDKDNGVLFLVAVEDREMFIATGYGIEGALPDGLVGEIRDRTIVPKFRSGDLAGGIEAGVDRMAAIIAREYHVELTGAPSPEAPPTAHFSRGDLIVLVIILLVIFGPYLFGWNGPPGARGSPRRRRAWDVGPPMWGGTFGGGGFGGSGGGGFGGFGGGSFGGGGAGGKW